MTDEQILAHQRAKHGDPYMPLPMAKKMQRFEQVGSRHRAAKEEGTGGALPVPEPCRYGDGTCLTHGRKAP